MHFYHESLIGMTDKFSHYFGVFVFVFSLTNVVRTVQAFSLYLGPKLYFNLNQISTYFVNKFLVIIIMALDSKHCINHLITLQREFVKLISKNYS